MHFDPNDRQSLTARVYEHIREDIIEGRYANGAYLVETKLAEELDVGLPLGETTGSFFTVRYLLEGQAAYWAAERIDAANLARLTEIVELMEMYTRKNDVANLARLDTEFHEVIFSASDSRILRHILTSLHRNTRQVRVNSLSTPDRPTHSLSEHRAIIEAIERKDAAAAKDAMESHVRNARKRRSAEGEAPDAQ